MSSTPYVRGRIAAATRLSGSQLLARLAAKRLEQRKQKERQKQTRLSTEQIAEAKQDFEKFCALVDIIPKDGQRCKFKLNAIQRRFNRERTGRDVVLKPRQIGFTTLEQARDVWTFLSKPGSRVVATCQSTTDHDPAKLLSKNYRVMLESLALQGWPLEFGTETGTHWELSANDSSLRIVEAGASEAAANKKGRAGTITRLHLSETAFYEYADQTLNALLECVPAQEYGSEIVSESTANGASGYFYRQCQAAEAGQSQYELHFYPWHEAAEYRTELEPGETIVPETEREKELFPKLVALGVTPEQLKWYRAKVSDKTQANADQEYPSDPETCFLVSGRNFFDQTTNNALIERSLEPIELRDRARIRIQKRPVPGRRYVIGCDTSEGGGLDASGAVVLDWETGEQAATLDGLYAPEDLAKAVAKLGYEYNTALIGVERNNHGHTVLLALTKLPDDEKDPQGRTHYYPAIYFHEDEKPGYPTTPVTRPVILDELESSHRGGHFKSPDRLLLAQFKTFVVSRTGKPEAAYGSRDDLVLAAAIGWKLRSTPIPSLKLFGSRSGSSLRR